jgi:hypothetical protein
VIASGVSTDTAAGAAGTLYHGERAGYKLSKKVDRIQKREADRFAVQ